MSQRSGDKRTTQNTHIAHSAIVLPRSFSHSTKLPNRHRNRWPRDGTYPKGIRRRERVIRVFPNDASALRLIGALLAEISEVWQEKLYFDMTEYHEWTAERKSTKERTKAA